VQRLIAVTVFAFLARCAAPSEAPPSTTIPGPEPSVSRPPLSQSKAHNDESKIQNDPFASALLVGGAVKAPLMIEHANAASPKGAKCRGLVMARVVIDETGTVVYAEDITPNPDKFTAAWVESYRKSRYRPATRDGVPVRVQFHQSSQIKCAR